MGWEDTLYYSSPMPLTFSKNVVGVEEKRTWGMTNKVRDGGLVSQGEGERAKVHSLAVMRGTTS